VKLIYSKHLINRLHLRDIPEDLPAEIVRSSKEHYHDVETGYSIAIKEVFIHDRKREMMVAYTVESDEIRVITIHPLKEGQKRNRLKKWPLGEEP
jgi:hypothetical protein